MYKWICLAWIFNATVAIYIGSTASAFMATVVAAMSLFLSVQKKEWR